MPALLATIRDEKTHPDIRAGALLALARTPDGARHLPLFLDLARSGGGESYEKIVAESAVLALGLLPECREKSREALLALPNLGAEG